MKNILALEELSQYIEQFNQLEMYGRSKGPRLDEKLGITYPPFPKGLNIGGLVIMLTHFSDCVESPSHKKLFKLRADHMGNGLAFFLRKRWPKPFKAIKIDERLSSSAKPLGIWLEALYDLCLQVAPYIPIEGRLGVDGADLFHYCVKDVLMANGAAAAFDFLYPPRKEKLETLDGKELKSDKEMRSEGERNKRQSREYLRRLVTRFSQLESPSPTKKNGGHGYLGTLLYYAILAVDSDKELRQGEMKKFVNATRAYFDEISSKSHAPISVSSTGLVTQKQGPKLPSKKVAVETTDIPTFQELSVFYRGSPKAV